MTTTVKVHTNGDFQVTVTRTVEGQETEETVVGPNEERSFNHPHTKAATFHVSAEREAPKEQPGIPEGGFSGKAA